MGDLTELELQVLEIDERIRPIATRPVDFDDLNKVALLAQRQSPLDEANVRSATEKLLEALATEYANGDEETRAAIRGLFVRSKHFAWAASFLAPPVTGRDFRHHLILFSMLDQGTDSRDAVLALQALCGQARAAEIEIGEMAREAAQISSDENKYGMGSTRQMLKNV